MHEDEIKTCYAIDLDSICVSLSKPPIYQSLSTIRSFIPNNRRDLPVDLNFRHEVTKCTISIPLNDHNASAVLQAHSCERTVFVD